MPIEFETDGPSKYDRECTIVREMTDAHGVVVLVVGGRLGSGFAVQTHDERFIRDLPRLLRAMDDDIERTPTT